MTSQTLTLMDLHQAHRAAEREVQATSDAIKTAALACAAAWQNINRARQTGGDALAAMLAYEKTDQAHSAAQTAHGEALGVSWQAYRAIQAFSV